jgi:hypothetical protein
MDQFFPLLPDSSKVQILRNQTFISEENERVNNIRTLELFETKGKSPSLGSSTEGRDGDGIIEMTARFVSYASHTFLAEISCCRTRAHR